jgi:hypothetical protein
MERDQFRVEAKSGMPLQVVKHSRLNGLNGNSGVDKPPVLFVAIPPGRQSRAALEVIYAPAQVAARRRISLIGRAESVERGLKHLQPTLLDSGSVKKRAGCSSDGIEELEDRLLRCVERAQEAA